MFLILGIPYFALVAVAVAIFRFATKERSYRLPLRLALRSELRNAVSWVVRLLKWAVPVAGMASAAQATLPQQPVGVRNASAPINHKFSVADAIHLVAYNDFHWSVTLKVYNEEGIVKRHLRCADPDLVDRVKQVYEKTVFEMEPLALASVTPDAMMKVTERDGLACLAKVLQGLEAFDEERAFGEFTAVPAEPSIEAVVPTGMPVGVATEMAPVLSSESTPSRPVEGGGVFRVRGTVMEATNVPAFTGKGNVFQVKLKADAGDRIEPFCGVDLASQCAKLGIKPGDRVAIGVRPNPRAEERGQPKKLFEVERI